MWPAATSSRCNASDIVATSFPPLCNLFQVWSEPRHTLARLLLRKGVPAERARDGRVADPHLRGDGCLRAALFVQGHDLFVVSQALFSLRLAHRGLLWTQLRRSFPPPQWAERWLLTPAQREFDEQPNDAPESLLKPPRDFCSIGRQRGITFL